MGQDRPLAVVLLAEAPGVEMKKRAPYRRRRAVADRCDTLGGRLNDLVVVLREVGETRYCSHLEDTAMRLYGIAALLRAPDR